MILRFTLTALVGAALLLFPGEAQAYVGPGAGIAVATTGFMLVISLLLAIVGILFWPFRWVYRQITRKRPPRPPKIKRAVLIGLDGLDPTLVQTMLDEGKLPNMQKIADKGGFQNLGTTFPAMSPVAWSSFATGVNPAKHGIFDFLTRDRQTYAPDLSSAEVRGSKRQFKIGNLVVPLGKAQIKLLRKSKPFWEVLGRHQVPCSILRVPITFPPDKFHGTQLSAMCVPDLQGTQGSFTYYYSAATTEGEAIGGARHKVEIDDGVVNAELLGPPNPMRADKAPVTLPFRVVLGKDKKSATMTMAGDKIELPVGEYTEWISVAFPLALGQKLRGICRFRLMEANPFRLYVTPINIDPENPILPISHPKFFATFLAKLMGKYATLGLAEDTWALNEGVIDEDAFLEQAWNNHEERESMFFEMLKRTPKGLVTCVFDGTDRIQHMFMRFMDDGHPAMRDDERTSQYKDVIPDTYARMDKMVGKVLDQVDINDPANLVAVLSDHGFQTFRRGINLNSWLLKEGYLKLIDDKPKGREWLKDVDWQRTKAFSFGLAGIFLNVEGRERDGQVKESEANALADELCDKLRGFRDEEVDAVAIRECYASHKLYDGPYAEDAPDVIVGYERGWRASWDGVRGITHDVICDDNTKAWSGDHCIDPELVPGVLVSSRKLGLPDNKEANIADMAPTMLDLFGIPAPRYMDGTTLVPKKEQASQQAAA